LIYFFSEKSDKFAEISHTPREGLPQQETGMARKWRRKPLKSLKTDSEMASRWLTVLDQVAKRFLSARLSTRCFNQAEAVEKSCAKEHSSH
jgi:hypothetical protein